MTEIHECEECRTQYPSFGAYTRNDPCYKARRAARWGDEDAFGQGTRSSEDGQYDTNTEAEIRKADAPERRTGANQYGAYTTHAASEKQVAFAKRLLAERPAYAATLKTPVDSLDKRQMSRLIDDLLKVKVEVVAEGSGPSEKQTALIERLFAERETGELRKDDIRTKAEASALIDALFVLPKKAAKAAKVQDLHKGDVHVVDGEYYRVHTSQSTGNLYAARFDGHRFDYERGAIRLLNADNKITAEQAAAFGGMYNACCFCSRALDTPESTQAGYGPVCAAKHHLPWG